MPITKSRQIAKILKLDGTVKDSLYDSDAIVTSAQLGVTPAAGTAIYSSADTLPASADNGDQALVSSTNRLYIFTNGGWYNIALINTSPYFTTSPDAAYDLSTIGAATVITILAVDSDGVPITYTATTDSDFDGIATVTRDSDSGRTFTVTPIDSEGGTSVAGTGTITFKASDGINLVSTVSTFSISFTINNSNHTTLLLTIDSTATDNQVDASSNNHTITEAGDIKSTAFTPYHPGGYSVDFNGSSDYIQIPDGDYQTYGDSDLTIECWIYPRSTSGDNYIISDYTSAGTLATSSLHLLVDDGVLRGYGRVGGVNMLSDLVGSTTIDTNKWHHVALTRKGDVFSIWLNGNLEDNVTRTGSVNAGTQPFTVGRGGSYPGFYFNGFVKDVRMIRGTCLYDSDMTVPTKPLTAIGGTEILLCNLPYLGDKSSNNHTVTAYGTPSIIRFGPYNYGAYEKATHGGSVYFDGTGDYLSLSASNDFDVSDGDITIECWVYRSAADTTKQCVWEFYATDNNVLRLFYEGNNKYSLLQRVSGTDNFNVSISGTTSLNKWEHLAVTRSSSGTYKLYINGVENISQAEGVTINTSSMGFNIGVDLYGIDRFWNGYISDFRIVKGSLVYSSNFTPPTAPLTAITNTSLLTCTNKSQVWDVSGSELPGPVYNNGASIQSGVTHTGFNAGYFLFDGTNDWIQIPYDLHQNANFGTGDFTIEFWLYPHVDELSTMIGNDIATPGNWNGWLIKRNSAPSQNTLYLQWNGSGMIETSLATAGAGTYTVNTWHHFAATRQNGTLRTFFNGNLIGSTSFTADMTDTNYLTIGMNNYAGGTEHFDGALKEIRFTKGLARYTSTFTPPTAEFKG